MGGGFNPGISEGHNFRINPSPEGCGTIGGGFNPRISVPGKSI
jgi:hypothetical protein